MSAHVAIDSAARPLWLTVCAACGRSQAHAHRNWFVVVGTAAIVCVPGMRRAWLPVFRELYDCMLNCSFDNALFAIALASGAGAHNSLCGAYACPALSCRACRIDCQRRFHDMSPTFQRQVCSSCSDTCARMFSACNRIGCVDEVTHVDTVRLQRLITTQLRSPRVEVVVDEGTGMRLV